VSIRLSIHLAHFPDWKCMKSWAVQNLLRELPSKSVLRSDVKVKCYSWFVSVIEAYKPSWSCFTVYQEIPFLSTVAISGLLDHRIGIYHSLARRRKRHRGISQLFGWEGWVFCTCEDWRDWLRRSSTSPIVWWAGRWSFTKTSRFKISYPCASLLHGSGISLINFINI